MRFKHLGRTGLFVSELCLGTMTFGGRGFWTAIGTLGQETVNAIVKKSIDAGINFIDTADVYSEGEAETLLGTALKTLGVPRQDLIVATKAFGQMGPGPNARGASRGHLTDAVEASLKRLRLDHIDLYQIHGFDSVTPIEETLHALDDLVRRGLVRYIGCSNWAAWQIMKALGLSDRHGWARFATLQAYYTIAGRDIEREIVPLLNDQGVGLMVWSPLAGGYLSGKMSGGGEAGARRASFDFPPLDKPRADRCIETMRGIAERHEVSIARVALAWLLAQPHVTSVIIGAKTESQLDDNLAATTLTLTPEDLAEMDGVSALPSEYPAWMMARQGANRIVSHSP